MTPLIIAASMLGQCGAGYTSNHCAGHGYCGFHRVYHQQAVFGADPYYLTQAVAGYIRQQAADAAREQANRDLSAKLDRIESALKATPPAPAPDPAPRTRHFDGRTGRELTPAEVAEIESRSVKRGPLPPFDPPAPPVEEGPSLSETLGPPPGGNPLAAALERCIACHTGDASSGNFVLFDDNGELATLDLKAKTKIHQRTKPDAPKRMPPKGGPLTPAERGVIADAIRSDLDAIASTLKD